ncbi:MAG: hypothetical protein M3Y79_02630 [Pseudomonadota bacterium]|nr:hypothetical protein [Pseudomonadota bacterium]
MKRRPSYLGRAFNARPLGMPIPPNWFGVAAIALLGALVHPGLWLVGLGLEGLYLWMLSGNPRFRRTVDADEGTVGATSRYETLLASLGPAAQAQQLEIEREAGEIVELLKRAQGHDSQIADVRQMAWLHLKLLSARAALAQVVTAAERERHSLDEQEKRGRARIEAPDTGDELRRSLEQQLSVIRSRKAAHDDARHRSELVDAELVRLRQQVSLVREQVLLATDEGSIGSSLDALSASLNEANRWLRDQSELFAGLDAFTDDAPPAHLLASRQKKGRTKVSE